MSWIAVGIGAAVGAAGGAAIGSKKGGDDVWKGALIGGVLGAGAGAGGAALAPEAAAVEGGVGAGAIEGGIGAGAVEGGSGLALGGAGLETGGAMATTGSGAGIASLPTGTGAVGSGVATGSSAAAGAAPAAAGGAAAPGFGSGAGMGLGQAGGFGGGATLSGSGASFGTTGGAAVAPTGGYVSSQLGGAAAGGAETGALTGGAEAGGIGGWWKGLSGLEQAGVLGAGTAGLGYLINQDNKQYGVPDSEDYSGPLSQFKYDPSKYKPEYAKPNVYEARYADGGIAALANSNDPMNPMNNPVYPQSQQEHTNFATSTQYPSSMKAAMASDYDARTSPTLGTEMPMGMAYGGMACYAEGGATNPAPTNSGLNAMYAADPNISAGMNTLAAFTPRSAPVAPAATPVAAPVAAAATPFANYGSTYAPVHVPAFNTGNFDRTVETYQNRIAREAREAAAAEEAARAAAAQNSNDTGFMGGFASGGSTGYGLGGYSDGGRMLRGPGDGVSDSIPATIGGKQPARLADGEFVVPARAVSELGNGSTEAGAKQLYSMLDRIQNKRKKGKGLAYQSNPKKMLPA